jgi:hypothetical protein
VSKATIKEKKMRGDLVGEIRIEEVLREVWKFIG